jgi:hypothetical protein
VRPRALLAVWLAAIACGPSGTGGTRPPAPAPGARPGTPAPSQPGTGGAAVSVARYTSSDARYIIDRADTITFQYPNGLQTQVVDRQIWVRLIIGPGAATAPVNITLDSIRVTNVPRDSLLSADGLRWTGTLEDGVRLGALAPSSHHALAEQLVGNALRDLVAALPPGGARAGSGWSDTTRTTEQVAGSEVPVTVTRTVHTVGRAGTPPALVLESSSALAGGGKSQRFGEEIGVTLTGTRTRNHTLSAGGQVLSAEGRDSLAITFDLPSVGQTVPATQRGTLRIERTQGSR